MGKITKKELMEKFEDNYSYKYKSDTEFKEAVYTEYTVEDTPCGFVFSGGDDDFIVTDWVE